MIKQQAHVQLQQKMLLPLCKRGSLLMASRVRALSTACIIG